MEWWTLLFFSLILGSSRIPQNLTFNFSTFIIRKLNDLLDALEFNQVVIFVSKVNRAVQLNKILEVIILKTSS